MCYTTPEEGMSTTEVRGDEATERGNVRTGDMNLEVVVPVWDADRAKRFTRNWAGGSTATPTTPDSAHNLYLIVFHIAAASDALVERAARSTRPWGRRR